RRGTWRSSRQRPTRHHRAWRRRGLRRPTMPAVTSSRSVASGASPSATRSSDGHAPRRRWLSWILRRQAAKIYCIYQVFDIRTDIRPTVAEVDLAALRKNVDVLAGTVGPGVGILAVVKADAYGHGALAVARALERKVWGFAVSLVEEGVE